nr:potassium transporter TrkH [Lachnospiraceae bacterium]
MLRHRISSVRLIPLSFLSAILLGAIILMLPISSSDGHFTGFTDALFTAATSVCVTGLTVVVTATHWSLFGKAVILLLIQIGGLG